MSRRPANQISALQTRAALWAAIRTLREFAPGEIRQQTRCSRSQVDDYLTGLVAAGIVARVAGRRGCYRLVKDTGIEPPRVRKDGTPVTQGLGREQMWQTMRLLREFSALDLSVHASTEEAPVSVATAKDYCIFLTRAGYLTRLRQGQGTGRGGVQTVYRFLDHRYTGPQPPMIQRVKAVYDPNLARVVWDSAGGCHDQK